MSEQASTLRYEMYVPQNLNDGSAVEANTLAEIEGAMEELFGGYTHNPTPMRGVWIDPTGKRVADTINVYTLFSDNPAAIFALAKYTCAMLAQDCVAVVYPTGEVRLIDAPTLAEVAR